MQSQSCLSRRLGLIVVHVFKVGSSMSILIANHCQYLVSNLQELANIFIAFLSTRFLLKNKKTERCVSYTSCCPITLKFV